MVLKNKQNKINDIKKYTFCSDLKMTIFNTFNINFYIQWDTFRNTIFKNLK